MINVDGVPRPVWTGLLAVVAVAALCAGLRAQAPGAAKDELVFTNGDVLSGKLTRIAGDSVVFHSDMAGDITISLSKVKELHTQGQFAVLKHGDPVPVSRKAVPGRLDVAEGTVDVTPKGAAAADAVPAQRVAYAIDEVTFNRELAHTPSLMDGWNGTVTLGATVVQATQHGNTFTSAVALTRQVPTLTFLPTRNRTLLNFQETYGTLTQDAEPAQNIAASTVKTSIMHANAERDDYLSRRLFVLATTTFDHNYSQLLQLQQIYGAGVGWTAVTNATQQLDIRVDAHYERQEFVDPASNANLFGSTFGETYRRALPLRVLFTEGLSLTPSWSNPSVYSGAFQAGLSLPAWKRLAVTLSATDSYLSNPPAGATKNSFQFVTGLSYAVR